ncbi:MAG TPA: KH domain-containing protein [Bacillota bacterium]
MKELVLVLARALVDNPDAVQVAEVGGPHSSVVELRVDPQDMGKVIGRQGRVVKAIRAVVKAAATKQGRKVSVEVVQ